MNWIKCNAMVLMQVAWSVLCCKQGSSFLSVKGKRVMGDFIQTNGAWLLSALALVGGGGTAMIAYMLKSRCTVIKCCCISCERDVLPANVVAAEAV